MNSSENNNGNTSIENNAKLDFDIILEKGVGWFGPWQMKIISLLFLVSMANGIITFVYTFTGYAPKYRCMIPFCEFPNNVTYYDTDIDYEHTTQNFSFAEYVMKGIPKQSLKDSSCKYYSVMDLTTDPTPNTESCNFYMGRLNQNGSDMIEKSCSSDQLVFDKSIIENSIVSEFNFTCDRKYIKSIIGAIYMVGLLLGSFLFGLASDKFGRIKTMMVAVVIVSVSGAFGAIPGSGPVWFTIMRFITGFGAKGLFMIAFVLTVEIVGPKASTMLGILLNVPFAIGGMILAWEAYNFRDWYSLQLVGHLPTLVLLALWFFVPESPRWLIASNQPDKAIEIINEGAKANGKETPIKLHYVNPGRNKVATEDSKKITILDLFRPATILIRTINLFFQWFSITLCYYGISYASTSLSGNPHTNVFLSAFIEIPGYIFAILVIDCWGRRPVLSLCQIIGGVGSLFAGLLADQNLEENTGLAGLQVMFSLIGKFGASAAFAIVYLYTAELYPTIIRTTAVGTCSTIARFGAIGGLLIEILGDYWKPAPNVFMGITTIIAGSLAIFLPETAGIGLPETMEQAIALSKRPARGLFSCIYPKSFKELFHWKSPEKEDSEKA